jgi:outer membrane protein TolC
MTLMTIVAISTFAQGPGSPRNYFEPADTAVERRLVNLALAGPVFDGSTHQNRINELELRRAKSAWLNLLTISTSYYDQSANKQTAGNTAFVYPKYYFSLSIPLGVIFSQGNQVKIAREGLALSKDKQEDLARQLKVDVLSKYKQYRVYSSLIDMQSEMINDVLVATGQVEDKFKKDQVTVDTYIGAQKTRNEELAKLLNLRLQQDLIKLDIEKIIGMPLDQIVRPYSPPLPPARK